MPNTGPTSPEAKALVSQNAVRHGLRAAAIVIPEFEQQEDWETFHEHVILNLTPEGPVELALADRVAELLWRLRRAARAERLATTQAQKHEDDAEVKHVNHLAEMAQQLGPRSFYGSGFAQTAAKGPRPVPRRLLPPVEALMALARYEAHLSRQLQHALHELQAFQDRRNGKAAPLARVDVSGLPGM